MPRMVPAGPSTLRHAVLIGSRGRWDLIPDLHTVERLESVDVDSGTVGEICLA